MPLLHAILLNLEVLDPEANIPLPLPLINKEHI
jgi:hypothetical protein